MVDLDHWGLCSASYSGYPAGIWDTILDFNNSGEARTTYEGITLASLQYTDHRAFSHSLFTCYPQARTVWTTRMGNRLRCYRYRIGLGLLLVFRVKALRLIEQGKSVRLQVR